MRLLSAIILFFVITIPLVVVVKLFDYTYSRIEEATNVTAPTGTYTIRQYDDSGTYTTTTVTDISQYASSRGDVYSQVVNAEFGGVKVKDIIRSLVFAGIVGIFLALIIYAPRR